jgi:hypothetical protein
VIERPATSEGIDFATGRIEDFYSVHGEWRELIRGLSVLRESLGLDDSLVDQLSTWVKDFTGDPDYTPSILLGLMLGLIVADHLAEVEPE